MVRSVVRRMVSAVLLLVVGAGGGGVPVLDILVFHGSDRAEAFRPHYEASSASCHEDGCSVRSLTQTRLLAGEWSVVRDVVPLESLVGTESISPASALRLSLPYLSRAPPQSA